MNYVNEMTLKFKSLSENEAFARACVGSFCLAVTNEMEVINDIKTAVSEAVTNCVVHAYPKEIGDIIINVKLTDLKIEISITDFGIGIENLEAAKEPFFTSKPDAERSGMGFTVMETFMDNMEVSSKNNCGTKVVLVKNLSEVKLAVGG